jgi:hypothetical protein
MKGARWDRASRSSQHRPPTLSTMSHTHGASRASCSNATNVFQRISDAFCSRTDSGVADRTGKAGTAREPECVEPEVLLLPLEERARA